ncbi:MAG: polyphosphate polymerase domain-containing protein [Planctomycetes bacterium]|nr:polyphosphate polymerase domain-containing protein [Planctomycetota bacterium]
MVDPATRWQRFEHKYLVDEALARKLRASAAAYVAPDPFAARFPGNRYAISSLYLDAPSLKLFHETLEGQKQRFKLRVRSYSDDPATPLHFEIKRRLNGVVQKVRCSVSRELGYALLEGSTSDLSGLDEAKRRNLGEFLSLQQEIAAQPQVLVRYDREAYAGVFDPEVRLTFDRDLRTAVARGYRVEVQRDDFLRVGDERVVVELKFDGRLPGWMSALVQRYQLDRLSFSKYGHSIQRAFPAGATTPM